MKIVIIGAGPGGVTVAETLRQYDKKMEIVMLTDQDFPPYAHPAMLEYFMSGQEAHFWKWKDIPERLELDYRSGTRVDGVDPGGRKIILFDSTTIQYDQLVIATGSRLFAPVQGADKPGIYNFKSLSAANKLVSKVRKGSAKSAIIAGAGFIGVEIALLLTSLGVETTLIEMADRVMGRMLDADIAKIVLGLLTKRGANVRLNSKIKAFMDKPHAKSVELESGEILRADLLIAATGVKPNIEFLNGSGIKTDWGILTDGHLRTNIPDIYAVGDVAETFNRITGKRYVYAIFPNAVAQARIAAYNILGWDIPYEGSDNMVSLKHLGLPIIAAGQTEGEELCINRDSTMRKLYLLNGHIVGFQLAGDIKGAGIYRSLMNNKKGLEPIRNRLLEPNFGIGYIPYL